MTKKLTLADWHFQVSEWHKEQENYYTNLFPRTENGLKKIAQNELLSSWVTGEN